MVPFKDETAGFSGANARQYTPDIRMSNRTITAVSAIALLLACPRAGGAHDIPADVTVHAFVKPEGSRLRLLVRAPLKAMRDVDFPLRDSGFLHLERVDAFLRDAATLWIADNIVIYERDVRLAAPRLVAVRISLPADRSFASYDAALVQVSGPPLTDTTDITWDQAMLDVLFEYPIASDRSQFSVAPAFARLAVRVVTVLRFVVPGGPIRAFEYSGDPGLVRLDPRWHQAAAQFVRLGTLHILGGADHLLFLLCLVIPLRRFRALVVVVTAFTFAHSVTLVASAWNLGPSGSWFPPLVETLIAASIVYMALENAVGGRGVQRRWALAFGFGLVHGFGFSFALRETLQFAGSHLLASLLAFNVGVEVGQVLVLAVMIPALHLLFRYILPERAGTIVVSALVAHSAWHWMTTRWGHLRQFAWPSFDAASLAGGLRLLMIVVAATAIAWIVSVFLERHAGPGV